MRVFSLHFLLDDVVAVDWESVSSSCTHTGKLPVAWLEENDYSDADHQAAISAAREPAVAVGQLPVIFSVQVFQLSSICCSFFKQKTLPTVSHDEVMSGNEGLWK